MRRFAGIAAAVLAAGVCLAAPAAAAGPALYHRPIVSLGANQSSNWSGYNQGTIEQGGTQCHQVEGTWVVPKASPHKAGEAEYSSSWAGIGGGCVDGDCNVTDGTLIQAGTEQDVDKSGKDSYSAWWEIIPEPATTIRSLTIHAGDRMHVAITEDPPDAETWVIEVDDLTTGRKFTTTTPYSSTYATAEWIEETPVVIDDNGHITVGPLPDLSRVPFDLAMTNGKPAHLQNSEQIQLVDPNSGRALATPSAVDRDADGFNVCAYAGRCRRPRRS
jgi:hypothetical protein